MPHWNGVGVRDFGVWLPFIYVSKWDTNIWPSLTWSPRSETSKIGHFCPSGPKWHVLPPKMATWTKVTNFGGLRSPGPHEWRPNVSIPFWHIYQWYLNPKVPNPNSICAWYFNPPPKTGNICLFHHVLWAPVWTRVRGQDAWITRAGGEKDPHS